MEFFLYFFIINYILISSFTSEHLTSNFIDKDIYKIKNDDLKEIANYEWIRPEDEQYLYIPIISSSDIHGHFYPNQINLKKLNYSQGGLDYLAKYVNIIRKEFNNKMLYLDAGDLFQGGTEASITNGDIIIDYFNAIKLDGLTIGNHEFDYNKSFIEEKINKSNFPFIVANLYDNEKQTKNVFGKKQLTSKVYNFTYNISNKDVEIKIGVIGITLNLERNQITGHGYDNIIFKNYKDIIEAESKYLRNEQKVNSVILLSHVGFWCINQTQVNLQLNLYKSEDKQEEVDLESDIGKLVTSLEKGVIDAVVAGHSHLEAHHWIGDIPVISPVNYGLYANIVYLAFDKNNNFKIAPNKFRIEGPLPICEKVFEKNLRCESYTNSEVGQYLPLIEYKFHGVKIEKDEALNDIHLKYDEIYNNFTQIICNIIGTEQTLDISKNGSFYLGNIVANFLREYTNSQISIVGYSSLRTYWNPGFLRKFNVYDLLPFGNKLCTFYLRGKELKLSLKLLQTSKRKFYTIGGVKQVIVSEISGEHLSSVKLYDGYQEEEICDDKYYLISADSYLSGGGDSFKIIMKYYNPKNLTCEYGVEADLLIKYLEDQEIVDVRKYLDEENPIIRFLNKNKDNNAHFLENINEKIDLEEKYGNLNLNNYYKYYNYYI